MPAQPAWLAGGKRGADASGEQLAAGAKSLKAAAKGAPPKGGGKKGKNGKGTKAAADEHPGAWWPPTGAAASEWATGADGGRWTSGEEEWWKGTESSSPQTGTGGGGERPPHRGRGPPRGGASELEDATLSLHKLTLRNSTDIRRMKHMLEEFWLVPLNAPPVKAGREGGKQYGIAVREKGKGHGMGPPHVTVALHFLKALHDTAKEMHSNEGVEQDTAWAEITIKNWIKDAYNQDYGLILCTETFLDFKIVEARNESQEEGLLIAEPSAGRAKVMISFNANPQLAVAMAQHKDKVGDVKMKEFCRYQTADLRMATGYLLQTIGGKKSDSAGPKTHLERVVEGNMRAMRGRGRTW